jgi:hypothetical protein
MHKYLQLLQFGNVGIMMIPQLRCDLVCIIVHTHHSPNAGEDGQDANGFAKFNWNGPGEGSGGGEGGYGSYADDEDEARYCSH